MKVKKRRVGVRDDVRDEVCCPKLELGSVVVGIVVGGDVVTGAVTLTSVVCTDLGEGAEGVMFTPRCETAPVSQKIRPSAPCGYLEDNLPQRLLA